MNGLKFSTRSKYGLNAMLHLAVSGAGPVSIKDISEAQSISEAYLEQIFIPLKKAGLIQSVRGSQGGYSLADRPENISIGTIIRTLDGPIAPADCVGEESAGCARGDACPGKLIWEKLSRSINNVIDSFSLADVLEEYNARDRKESC